MLCRGIYKLVSVSPTGSFSVVDIAFNPGVLEENKDDKSAVYLLALRFVQQHHGLKLSEQYSVISYSPRSSQTHLHRRLGFQQRTVTPEQPSKGRALQINCYRCHIPLTSS